MKIALLIISTLFSFVVLLQEKPLFRVKNVEIERQEGRKLIAGFKNKVKSLLYEDENYTVKRFCRGEFGGTVRFKSKKTGKEYQCRATCAVAINRLNGRYYITNSLMHMSGRGQVLEIKDPEKISPVSPDSKVYLIDEREYLNDEDMGSITNKGVTVLADTTGIMAIGSFPFQNKLYHLVVDKDKTYLAEIRNKRFNLILVLAEKQDRTLLPEAIRVAENHYILKFYNWKNEEGHVDILDNQITVYFYK